MTVKANLRLCRCLQNGIPRRVTYVTVCAGNFFIVMRPVVPAEADLAVMAVQAQTVACANTAFIFGPERRDGGTLLPASYPGRMVAAWAVTGLTLQLALAERAARIRWYAVLSLEYSERLRIVMTGDTGIGTFPAVRDIGGIFVGRYCPVQRRYKDSQERH